MYMYIYPNTYTHTDRHTYILRCVYSLFLYFVCVLHMIVVLDFDSFFHSNMDFTFPKIFFKHSGLPCPGFPRQSRL